MSDAEQEGNPQPGQPRMFGAPVGSAELTWQWVAQQLEHARNYWIATTRPSGQPHSRPIWGVWQHPTFYFSTGSLAARNLLTRPAITVHLESGLDVVILEGTATPVDDPARLRQVVQAYNQKYQWNMDADQLPGPFFQVQLQVAFGWRIDEAKLDPDSTAMENATCWRFP